MSQPLPFPKVFLFSNPPNSGSAENILAPPNSHTLHSGVVQAPNTISLHQAALSPNKSFSGTDAAAIVASGGSLMGQALSNFIMQLRVACNMNRYLSGLHANLTDLQARLENVTVVKISKVSLVVLEQYNRNLISVPRKTRGTD